MQPYYETTLGKLYHGDCLEILPKLDIKVHMVCCDPPYGTTACKWDSVIPFDKMWEQINRIIKYYNCAVVLFGSEPFSSALRISNIKNYKYDWIWNKKLAGNGILAKKQPLKIHEMIHIFSGGGGTTYYPQKIKGRLRKKLSNLKISEINNGDSIVKEVFNDEYYPKSIQNFSLAGLRRGRLHPTQKPVKLMEYLIKTYTKKDNLVLDFSAGSGTTGIACENTNRNWIMIEKEQKYCDVIVDRLKKLQGHLPLPNNEIETNKSKQKMFF